MYRKDSVLMFLIIKIFSFSEFYQFYIYFISIFMKAYKYSLKVYIYTLIFYIFIKLSLIISYKSTYAFTSLILNRQVNICYNLNNNLSFICNLWGNLSYFSQLLKLCFLLKRNLPITSQIYVVVVFPNHDFPGDRKEEQSFPFSLHQNDEKNCFEFCLVFVCEFLQLL